MSLLTDAEPHAGGGPFPEAVRRRWARRVAAIGIGVTVGFVVIHLVNDATAELQFFDMNDESNLPTWWSSFVFTVAGLLALFVGLPDRAQRPWVLLGVLMLLLGLDDIATLHERMETQLGGTAAILVLEPLIALAIFFIFVSVARITHGFSRWCIVGGLVALVVAQASSSLDFVHDTIPLDRTLLTVFEEGAEDLFGVLIIAAAVEPFLALLDGLHTRRFDGRA